MLRALAFRMGKTLRQLKREMTWAEFEGWKAFFIREPFDDRRCFDLPAARITQALANAWRASNTDPFPIEAFLPFREEPSVEDLEARILRDL